MIIEDFRSFEMKYQEDEENSLISLHCSTVKLGYNDSLDLTRGEDIIPNKKIECTIKELCQIRGQINKLI